MTSPPRPPADRTDLLSVIEAAGLLSPAQFAKATGALPPAAVSASQAAQFLTTTGILTRFQAERLLAGRTDGFVLGSCVIQEQVGRGSIGRVYRATHRAMNRTVAIKVLSPDLTRTPAAREAFQREVRAAARLNHPNVVTAYDANEVGDRPYLVLEFVDGPTMDALVRERGPLPIGEACELVRQAAVGLQHAHEQGMIHRDVKPANLLVARASKTLPGCVVKIADFGLARLAPVARGTPAAAPAEAAGATLVGTPDYVAPEQAHNPQLSDHRADLYSLGCVFYFLLTGRPPFSGGTAGAKVRRHQLEAPMPVERVRPDVPPAVAEVVGRLLAKDPNSRIQSAAGLAARLDGLAGRAVALDEDGLVNFDLPAVQPGSYSASSGYLTGRHSTLPQHQSAAHTTLPANGTAVAASPWAQLTDEIADATVSPVELGTADTPVAAPAAVRKPVKPPAALPRAGGVSGVTILVLCSAVVLSCVLVAGYVLRGLAK